METFSALLALCAGKSLVTGEFPAQRQVTRRFWCFLRRVCALNKRLSKQSWGWWFETPSRPLWLSQKPLHPELTPWWSFLFCRWCKLPHSPAQPRMVRESSIHYNNVIMSVIASQITSLTIVYSRSYSGANQRKHQSSASLAFVRGIHRWPVNFPHKRTVKRKIFPLDDVIMNWGQHTETEMISFGKIVVNQYTIKSTWNRVPANSVLAF